VREAARTLNITVSLRKMAVVLRSNPGLLHFELTTENDGTTLKHVNGLAYLGSCLTSSCSMDSEVSNQLAKADVSFEKLWKGVRDEHDILINLKLECTKLFS